VAPTEQFVVVVVYRIWKAEPPHAVACGRVHKAPVSTYPVQTQSLHKDKRNGQCISAQCISAQCEGSFRSQMQFKMVAYWSDFVLSCFANLENGGLSCSVLRLIVTPYVIMYKYYIERLFRI
jgi:hypothetical protein